jgi:hypothetical protein
MIRVWSRAGRGATPASCAASLTPEVAGVLERGRRLLRTTRAVALSRPAPTPLAPGYRSLPA